MSMLNDTILELELAIEAERTIRVALKEEEAKKGKYEAELWLNTDFAKELKGKANNDKTRKALIDHKMLTQYIDKVTPLENDYNYVKRYIDFLNKKILVIVEVNEAEFYENLEYNPDFLDNLSQDIFNKKEEE